MLKGVDLGDKLPLQTHVFLNFIILTILFFNKKCSFDVSKSNTQGLHKTFGFKIVLINDQMGRNVFPFLSN